MYVFGASGHGKAVIEIAEFQDKVEGVFDDDPSREEVLGYRVSQLPDTFNANALLFIAIGDNRIRKEVAGRVPNYIDYATLIHPSALVSKRSFVGLGTVVMEGAVIKVHASIGKQVIINTCASVDHDCYVGDYVHLAPRATLCGGASVGEGTMVGAGSVVVPGIKIASWCKIGAGSVVTKDVPDGATWIGSGLKNKDTERLR